MSNVSFPNQNGQPGFKYDIMTITGASVSSSALGSGGLDKRGKFTATCKSNGANQITVKWISSYSDTPLVVPVPLTANVGINFISQDASGFVYETVERDDNTTPVNNANVSFFIVGLNTTAVFS